MIRAAALALALIGLAPAAFAQPAFAQIGIKGDWITLGDVAPVTGSAAGILIGPAPPPGQTLALDPMFLVSVAKKAGVILAIPLDQPIWVTRAGGTATPAPVANPARPANIAPQIGGGNSTPEQILVLVRDVPRGQRITQSDLNWADAPSARPVRNAASDMTVVIGMEAVRMLKAGQTVLSTDLKQASVIKKGEAVKIVYVAPGLRLTVDGIAQGEAAKGETVRVLSNYSKRTIDAVAEREGEARVGTR